MGAGEVNALASAAEAARRLAVKILRGLIHAQQRARARLDSQRLVGAAGAGGLREPVEGLGRAGRLSAPGFVDRYNQTARPFSWKFTASDLHGLMDRISRHE